MMSNAGAQEVVFTIGHSNLELDDFMGLLGLHGIEVLLDVRSSPYSKYVPQFNRDVLEEVLRRHEIGYVFLGAALGGRPPDVQTDSSGRPDYDAMAREEPFLAGIERLAATARGSKVCILCSEEDPGHCHRGLLIGEVLVERGVAVSHIRKDGSIETQQEMCMRMAKGQLTLF